MCDRSVPGYGNQAYHITDVIRLDFTYTEGFVNLPFYQYTLAYRVVCTPYLFSFTVRKFHIIDSVAQDNT